ncbi:MAG TPA: type II secretion system protein GspG [Candidatus Polarisedimenticolia bacterium]|nr:type II secretion system protein GspG [Candidatus Polarisedimenticolia bacterium]
MRPALIRVVPAIMLCFLGPVAGGCGRGSEPTVAEDAAAAAARGLDRARNERTLNRLEQLRTALARYAIDHDGSFPEGSSLGSVSAELAPRYLPILEAEDAWGNTMTYASDGRTYSVVSAGPDGVSGSEDDIALRDGAVAGGT